MTTCPKFYAWSPKFQSTALYKPGMEKHVCNRSQHLRRFKVIFLYIATLELA